jgi:hypothetical protein
MSGTKLSQTLLSVCALLFAAGIGFRAFVYNTLYIAPGEPFGVSDVIELLLGGLLLVALGSSILTAVVLAIRGPREDRVAAGWLVTSAVFMAVFFSPLHTLAANWSSR